MTRYRISPILFVVACLLLACAPTFAAARFNRPVHPNQKQFNMNTPRMQAARQWAMADRMGTYANPNTVVEGWTPKYTRYVNCQNSPYGSTYPDIESALLGTGHTQGPVLPYTLISVCAGTYSGGNTVDTSYVAIQGQGHSGAVTINCASTSVNGFNLYASYDRVKNVTINGCDYGVYIYGEYFPVKHDEVSYSNFNNNNYGVYSEFADYTEVEYSEFSGSYDQAIYAEYDTSDNFAGNEIFGTGSTKYSGEGIYIYESISEHVRNNQINFTSYGVDVEYSEFADVEYNNLNGNYDAVYFYDTDGSEVEHNHANGGSYGIYMDTDTGADSTYGQLPNRILYNYAFGNSIFDYYDATAGYTGYNSGTNDGTANYYHGNKGNTASPGSILTS